MRKHRKKITIKIVSRAPVGRCFYCRAWFSTAAPGMEIKAGRKELHLCAADSRALLARYGHSHDAI